MATIKSVGKNKWRVRVFIGYTDKGTIKCHSKVAHGLKKDAEAYAREKETARDLGLPLTPIKLTLGKHIDYWLAEVVAGSVQPRTHEDYTEILQRYVRPVLGEVLLGDLQPEMIQKLYNDMSRRGLSGRTLFYRQLSSTPFG